KLVIVIACPMTRPPPESSPGQQITPQTIWESPKESGTASVGMAHDPYHEYCLARPGFRVMNQASIPLKNSPVCYSRKAGLKFTLPSAPKITPAASKAVWMASRLAAVNGGTPSMDSDFTTVMRATSALCASSAADSRA
ncbi:MAG: hypothetical protein ACLGP3_09440, partial [Acidobacteriota bacterium]